MDPERNKPEHWPVEYLTIQQIMDRYKDALTPEQIKIIKQLQGTNIPKP